MRRVSGWSSVKIRGRELPKNDFTRQLSHTCSGLEQTSPQVLFVYFIFPALDMVSMNTSGNVFRYDHQSSNVQ